MTGLLYWLSRERDIQSALSRLLNVIPLKEREYIREKLLAAVQMYKLENTEILSEEQNDENYLLCSIENIHFQDPKLSQRINHEFLDKYRQCIFPSWLLDVMLHKQIFLPCQVEDKEQTSAHFFAESILQKICAFCLGCDTNNQKSEREVEIIKTVGREGSKCVSKTLECNIINCLDGKGLDESQSVDILLQSLGHDKEHRIMETDIDCDQNLKILFLCLQYWCSHTDNFLPATKTEFAAVIAMIALYQHKVKLKTLKEQHAYNEKFRKLFTINANVKSHRKEFDIAIIQSFANLQATIMYTILLNRLLGFPLKEPPIHKLWNGTLLYNLAYTFNNILEMQSYLNLEEFNDSLNFCKKVMPASYQKLKDKVIVGKRKRPRNRRATKNTNSQVTIEIEDGSINGNFSEEGLSNEELYEDLHNKFSLLSTE